MATLIGAFMPGRVVDMNGEALMFDGLKREIDINLGNVYIQVKKGRARGLAQQLVDTKSRTGVTAIGYAPDMLAAAWNAAAREGTPIARTPEKLIAMLRELG
ncbi:hypothetical protein ACFV5G_23355 [Streptomyces sp. NPDC059766]|uniref:hypothetical protein n=1 Tax=Streptomyces sp. NPDC059766 TaxID=3346940 RepID=UPI0036615CDF